MLLEVLAFGVIASGLAALGLVAVTAYKSQAALRAFKSSSNGLPIAAGAHWLYNHTFYPIAKDVNHVAIKMHKKYGDTVGLLYRTQFMASSVDLDLIKLINQDECQQHINKLKTQLPMEEFEQSIVATGGEDWRQTRRVFGPAFRPHKFMTPVVIGEIQKSIDKLVAHIERKINIETNKTSGAQKEEEEKEEEEEEKENNETHVDVDDVAHKFSMDLVLRSFYRQENQIDFDDPKCEWTNTMVSGFQEMQTSKVFKLALIFPILTPLVDWLMWNFAPLGKWRRAIKSFVEEQTKRGIELRKRAIKLGVNLKSEEEHKTMKLDDGSVFKRNLSDYIIDKFLEGKLTKRQYINSSCFLLPAADKTAADAIGHTLYLLAIDKRVQNKARASIALDGVGSEYLGWVINESLRVFTPASSGCGRVITRNITTKEGYCLPNGTFITTPAWAIHKLKKYWGDDAEQFKPERWQDTSHHHQFQFLAFGGGLRVCPGREFAIFQMRMVLAELLKLYSLDGKLNPDIYHLDCPFFQTTLPYAPTFITFKKRLQSNKDIV